MADEDPVEKEIKSAPPLPTITSEHFMSDDKESDHTLENPEKPEKPEKSEKTEKLEKSSQSALEEALLELQDNSLSDRLEALETLIIYVHNLMTYPDDKKYRRVSKSNIHYEERLGRLKGSLSLMKCLGFEVDGEFFIAPDKKDVKINFPEIHKSFVTSLAEVKKEFAVLPKRLGGDHEFHSVQGAGAFSAIGKRVSMEDDEIMVDSFSGDETMSYFGLYDGHGGRETVDFVVKTLHMNLEHYLKRRPDADFHQAFTDSYLVTDGQLRRQNILKSGTTAVTCVVRTEKGKRMLYTANVGDSRAVLCRDKQAICLTVDHKPTLPEETKRIKAAGGDVRGKRVNGVLAISRALGDHLMLKENDVVSASPYCTSTELTDTDDYLILACDGVWDVMSNQEACDFIYSHVKEQCWNHDLGQDGPIAVRGWKPSSKAESLKVNDVLTRTARALVDQALELRSQDNVTVMFIKL